MSPATNSEKLEKLQISMDLNSRDIQAHAKTITVMTEDQAELRKMVGTLYIDKEVQAVKDTYLSDRLDRIEKTIEALGERFSDGNKEVKRVLVGLAVTFITVFITAAAMWIIKGGLSGGLP